MPTEFAFKRGPVRDLEVWQVHPKHLQGPKGQQIAFKQVTEAHFAYTPRTSLSISQLILKSDDTKIALQCNAKHNSDSFRAFAGLAHAILSALARNNPNVMFTPPPANTLGMRVGQSLGVIGLVYGVYFMLIKGLIQQQHTALGIGLGALFTIMSLFWIWALNPGRPDPKSVKQTLAQISAVYEL